MPAELAEQWRRAPELLEALGWSVSGSDTLEADDLMFSYAHQEAAGGGSALLLTGDRDLYGAVEEHVAVVETRKGGAVGLVGPAEVRERYGVPPELVPDFIALRGDPSDGLPGAPGVGAKTAAELLRRYGPLEQVLDAAAQDATRVRREEADMRPRTAASLRENAELLQRFKLIATLQRVELEPPASRPTDFERGAEVAAEMGMRRLSERLQGLAAP
jgi:DNA polymerase-1